MNKPTINKSSLNNPKVKKIAIATAVLVSVSLGAAGVSHAFYHDGGDRSWHSESWHQKHDNHADSWDDDNDHHGASSDRQDDSKSSVQEQVSADTQVAVENISESALAQTQKLATNQ